MSPDLEPRTAVEKQQQFVVTKQQQEVLINTGKRASVEMTLVEEVDASVAVAETWTSQAKDGSCGFDTSKQAGNEVEAGPPAGAGATAPVDIEDMDDELLQEQAQAVVEELQKRGACTTLALAKMLGMEKSAQLNPLLSLLLEKTVIARVTDFPPIWALSPTFPMSSFSSLVPGVTAAPSPVVHAAAVLSPFLAPRSISPAPSAILSASPVAYSSVQPTRIMPHQPQARYTTTGTVITFPPIPAEPAESTPIPATSDTLQQADYWQSLFQLSGGKNSRNGGGGPAFKKSKKQKNLSELQLRLLKELKERGPTRTLELSKLVGLVTTRDVNPSIYDLKQRNLVVKVNNAPPIWQLNEPGMSKAQSISGMGVDDDEDQFERDIQPVPLIADNSQGISSLSFFH